MTPLIVVAGTVIVIGVLLAIARRLIPGEHKQPHHDVASAIFSMVGVLYAVILAFVVIVVWENDSKANDDAQIEANDVAKLYFTARSMPEPQRGELMGIARDYAGVVTRDEWPLMQHSKTSPKARELVARMRGTAQGIQPATAREEILMGGALDAINELVDARRQRTGALTSPVSPLMWGGLIAGSAITIGFTFFFDHSRFVPHLIMVGSMSALIAFTLWLIYDMSLPFSGTSAIGPDAFAQILQRFRDFP
ncbi:MAG TPA: DUF4239 domain-containing protein [Micromonosporaceae bacterium]|nr:DUF4239 domain-containing protein [Micromonosporaceae bacterium]